MKKLLSLAIAIMFIGTAFAQIKSATKTDTTRSHIAKKSTSKKSANTKAAIKKTTTSTTK